MSAATLAHEVGCESCGCSREEVTMLALAHGIAPAEAICCDDETIR